MRVGLDGRKRLTDARLCDPTRIMRLARGFPVTLSNGELNPTRILPWHRNPTRIQLASAKLVFALRKAAGLTLVRLMAADVGQHGGVTCSPPSKSRRAGRSGRAGTSFFARG